MSEFKKIETQEDLDKIIEARLARQKESITSEYSDYEQLKTRNAELEANVATLQATIDGSSKTSKAWEQEKADLNAKIAGYETANLKQKIAIQAGLPLDLADRLTGENEEALKADAERFSGFIKPRTPTAPLKGAEPPLPTESDDKDEAYKKLIKNINSEGE